MRKRGEETGCVALAARDNDESESHLRHSEDPSKGAGQGQMTAIMALHSRLGICSPPPSTRSTAHGLQLVEGERSLIVRTLREISQYRKSTVNKRDSASALDGYVAANAEGSRELHDAATGREILKSLKRSRAPKQRSRGREWAAAADMRASPSQQQGLERLQWFIDEEAALCCGCPACKETRQDAEANTNGAGSLTSSPDWGGGQQIRLAGQRAARWEGARMLGVVWSCATDGAGREVLQMRDEPEGASVMEHWLYAGAHVEKGRCCAVGAFKLMTRGPCWALLGPCCWCRQSKSALRCVACVRLRDGCLWRRAQCLSSPTRRAAVTRKPHCSGLSASRDPAAAAATATATATATTPWRPSRAGRANFPLAPLLHGLRSSILTDHILLTQPGRPLQPSSCSLPPRPGALNALRADFTAATAASLGALDRCIRHCSWPPQNRLPPSVDPIRTIRSGPRLPAPADLARPALDHDTTHDPWQTPATCWPLPVLAPPLALAIVERSPHLLFPRSLDGRPTRPPTARLDADRHLPSCYRASSRLPAPCMRIAISPSCGTAPPC
ncbi:hypothetical protein SVAN01_00725 [Stagonosporopsis vannaccii]|nr:hypothetical protein SVAN01_00725 [Stagonosporopsis vannaccii]